jgi:hypothetical protein
VPPRGPGGRLPHVALMPQWRQNYPNNRPPTRATAISEMGQNPPPVLQKISKEFAPRRQVAFWIYCPPISHDAATTKPPHEQYFCRTVTQKSQPREGFAATPSSSKTSISASECRTTRRVARRQWLGHGGDHSVDGQIQLMTVVQA